MANNEVIDGTLSVGGAALFSGAITAAGAASLGGAVISNSGATTSTAGATTLNAKAGVITTEAVTNAAQATYALAITNSAISAGDIVFASVQNGNNTGGIPVIGGITTANGKLTIGVVNAGVTATAFNGTLKVSFFAFK